MTTPHPTATQPQSARTPSGLRRLIGLVSGAAAALAMLAFPAPEGLPAEAWRVAAITILMATCWVWEVIPIAATAGLSMWVSNTATAATFLPLAGSFAALGGVAPVLVCAPVARAANCAFMMPVATPPNAIVFASGQLTVPDMIKAGALVNAVAVGLPAVFVLSTVPAVLG